MAPEGFSGTMHTSHAFTSSSEMGREPYLSPCTHTTS